MFTELYESLPQPVEKVGPRLEHDFQAVREFMHFQFGVSVFTNRNNTFCILRRREDKVAVAVCCNQNFTMAGSLHQFRLIQLKLIT